MSRNFFIRGRTIAAAVVLATVVFGADISHASDAVETSGDVLRAAIPALAVAMTFRNHDKEGRRQFLKSFGANVVATWALKEALDKQRPDGSGGGAFPSGHSSMAFQGAAFIHARYGLRKAWPSYAMATYVAWTRVDSDQHDVADVAAGAALGIATSMLLTRRFPEASVAVAIDRGSIGFRINKRL